MQARDERDRATEKGGIMKNVASHLGTILLGFAICVVLVSWAQNKEPTRNAGKLKFDQSGEPGKPNKVPTIPGLTAAPGRTSNLLQALSESSLVPESLRGGGRSLVNFDKSAANLALALRANPALSEVTPGAPTNPLKVKGLSGMALRSGDKRFALSIISRDSRKFLPGEPDQK